MKDDILGIESIEDPVKRELKPVLSGVVDNFDQYDVGAVEHTGGLLRVELHHENKSVAKRHTVTVEVDQNP